jgi:hypothetical protein
MPAGVQIEASSSIADFVNRLEKFDKDVSKELKAGMRKGVGYVVKEAQRRVPPTPLRNWAVSWIEQDRANGRYLMYDQAAARRGIKAAAFRARKRGSTVGFGYQAVQKDPAASIFELAGSRNPGGGPQSFKAAARGGSPTFNRNVLNKFGSGPYPRVLYPAYYAGISSARDEIDKALQEARRRVGL